MIKKYWILQKIVIQLWAKYTVQYEPYCKIGVKRKYSMKKNLEKSNATSPCTFKFKPLKIRFVILY